MPRVTPPDFLVQRAYSRSIIEQKIHEKMITIPMLAKKLGVSETGLYLKKREPERLNIRELRVIAKATGMNDLELVSLVRGYKVEAF